MTGRGLVFALGAVVLWGLWAFFGKLALSRGMRPVDVFAAEAFAGMLVAVVVVAAAYSLHVPSLAVSLPDWNLFGVLSGSAMALGLLLYYVALEVGDVSVVSPLTAAYPAIAILLGIAVLGESLNAGEILGVVMVLGGSVLLAFSSVS